jgi:hypothetical protein
MASNINPYNIDTTFPIAGQDNDTQGFRTNYTSIQNNFLTAAGEITSLQSNVATIQTTFLPSYSGTISASSLNITNGVFWANGASALYNNAQVSTYLSSYTGNITAGNLTVTNLTCVNNVTVANILTLGSAIQFANLTTAKIAAITSPQRGMTVYNYNTGNVQVYNGTKWANVTLS